jgi:hypothetical protein
VIVLDPLLAAVTTVSLDSTILLLEDGETGPVSRVGTGSVLRGTDVDEELRLDEDEDEEEFAAASPPSLTDCDVAGELAGS